MKTQPIPICSEHHISKEWQLTTFEYADEGVTVRVPDVYAWVCPTDDEASFTPETVDELISTVRELLQVAERHSSRPEQPVQVRPQ